MREGQDRAGKIETFDTRIKSEHEVEGSEPIRSKRGEMPCTTRDGDMMRMK